MIRVQAVRWSGTLIWCNLNGSGWSNNIPFPTSFQNSISAFFLTYLVDAFIQSELQCIQAIHFFVSMCVPLGIEPTTFALLTQCSTTEPQELFSSTSKAWLLCTCCTHEPVLHFICRVCVQLVQRCSGQASLPVVNIWPADRTGTLSMSDRAE